MVGKHKTEETTDAGINVYDSGDGAAGDSRAQDHDLYHGGGCMNRHKKWSFIGFNYYQSAFVERFDFCGLIIYAAAGQCRTLFGYSWVVEQ